MNAAIKVLAANYLKELGLEYTATRKCLERVPENLFDFKPHPKSMPLGYLSALVAAIPLWIHYMVEKGEIDFVTFPKTEPETNAALLDYYEDNIAKAKASLEKVSDEELQQTFYLKSNGKTVYAGPKSENIMTTLNHWVHHRGQLTVYMRLNDIAVPSVYGPSADDKGF